MKKIIIVLGLLLYGLSTQAQKLKGGEYFFDTAPAIGGGIAFNFSASDTVNQTLNVPVSNLSSGFHYLFVRVKNTVGIWSHYEGRLFYKMPTVVVANQPTLVAGEWFVDTDPGIGNGTAIPFAQADTVSKVLNISASAFSTGFHYLFIRLKNASGIWSHYEGRLFYVMPTVAVTNQPALVAGEWFVDTDPGIGNGTAIPFAQADTVSKVLNINATAFTTGFHYLFIRVKNASGIWSHYEGRLFYVMPNVVTTNQPALVAGEWFVDTDPGIGSGTAITFAQADTVNPIINVSTPNLSLGVHHLFIRVRNANNTWSLYEGRRFVVCSSLLAAPVITGFMQLCTGVSLKLYASTVSGATSYFWRGPNGFSATTKNITINNAAVLNSGTYTVVAVKGNADCDTGLTAAVTVSVNVKPTISVTPATTSLCIGDSIVLTASGAATYAWSPATNLSATNVAAVYTKAITNTTYTVTGTNTFGCSKTASVVVSANAKPAVTVTPATSTICPGNTAVLNATGTATVFAWSPVTGLNQTTGTPVNANPIITTTYTVTGSSANGCTATKTAKVTASKPKPANLTATNIAATSATLNWDTVSCAIAYKLQYRKQGVSAWTSVNTTAPTKAISGLLTATVYQYRVKAKYPDLTFSSNSTVATFTTLVVRAGEAVSLVADDLKVYPNPATDKLNIEFPFTGNDATIQVINAIGQTMLEQKANVDDEAISLNIENLMPGLYLINVINGDTKYSTRFIKK